MRAAEPLPPYRPEPAITAGPGLCSAAATVDFSAGLSRLSSQVSVLDSRADLMCPTQLHLAFAASLTRFVGARAYDVGQLRADLDRFAFLLGGNDGERLFNPDTE